MMIQLSESQKRRWGEYFGGKTVWITGASSGIGAQLALLLNTLGAKTILSARSIEGLKRVQNLLENPDASRLLPLDLEQLDTLPAKANEATALFGPIDILINNAALPVRDFILDTDLAVDQKLMRINYFGPISLTKLVLKAMVGRGTGQVVAISSLSAKFGVPRTGAYAASKHALQGFFECLQTEITEPGIAFTIIVPGIINTQITAHALKGDGSKHGVFEQTFQQGYPVEKAALKIIDAIAKRKEEVFVGGKEGITLWIYRISPYLFTRFIRNHPLKRFRRLKKRLFGKAG